MQSNWQDFLHKVDTYKYTCQLTSTLSCKEKPKLSVNTILKNCNKGLQHSEDHQKDLLVVVCC